MVPWGINLTMEHQEALDNVSVSFFAYVDNIFMIKDIYDSIGSYIRGISSPYLNFRDALFHYRKMYEAARDEDNTIVLQQMACIDEHLNRGIRDFAINLCSNYYVPILHTLMSDKAQCITDEVFQRLRQIYHSLKSIVTEIRLGGQQLKRFDNVDIDWLIRIIGIIQNFNNLLDEFPQVRRLYDMKRKAP